MTWPYEYRPSHACALRIAWTNSSNRPCTTWVCAAPVQAPQMPPRVTCVSVPPSIPDASTSATRSPLRAALMAAKTPLVPPPTTTRS
ncbi:Uncharacterised protein [Bordetella pertussis]|nr:Uncharacterised protein [Bordetella pertussis]